MQPDRPAAPSEDQIRAQLTRILASAEFAGAARSARFLEYVVDQTLVGAAEQIKEFVIAVEVFGRKESYDSREHSAVRVEATRLRQRLKAYYESAGVEDQVAIELPKGKYVPSFSWRQAVEEAAVAPAKRQPKWVWIAAGVGIAVLGGWYFRGSREKVETFHYRTLTDRPGAERGPSLGGPGDAMALAKQVGGHWHIFLGHIQDSGRRDLTADSAVDNTQPALSPDGSRVAFRSERDGGGIFVVEVATGALTRISDFCFNPAWSPDGRTIACASEAVLRPEQRLGSKSSLWTIDLATERKQEIFAGDAVQPAWSPGGQRIAFWAADENRARDVWTVGAGGENPRPVFTDEPLDWCPRWSPDGKWLYFLSDRDGAMNLWRVAIDEASGEARGKPEPQTTPAIDMSVFSLARNGSAMAYENRVIHSKLVRQDLKSGEATTIVEMSPARQPAGPDVSADGKWLTFYTIGKEEEIYVVRTDGGGLRRLVYGDFRSRGPRWSPDGRQIAFQSTKSGRAEIWIVGADGGGLRQLTNSPGAQPIQPVWSPDGASIAYSRTDGDSAVVELAHPDAPKVLPARGFQARSWSRDGEKLLGQMAPADRADATMAIYDLKSQQLTILGPGNMQFWDPDGVGVLYEKNRGVWRMDAATRKTERLAEFKADRLGGLRRSPDRRYLYVGVTTIDSDIWVRERAR